MQEYAEAYFPAGSGLFPWFGTAGEFVELAVAPLCRDTYTAMMLLE